MLLHPWQEVHHLGVVGWLVVEFFRPIAQLLMFCIIFFAILNP